MPFQGFIDRVKTGILFILLIKDLLLSCSSEEFSYNVHAFITENNASTPSSLRYSRVSTTSIKLDATSSSRFLMLTNLSTSRIHSPFIAGLKRSNCKVINSSPLPIRRGRHMSLSKIDRADCTKIEDEARNPSQTKQIKSIPIMHHTAIRTRDIEMAIKFYSLLGFTVETKFRAGPARAAWLTTSTSSFGVNSNITDTRLEIIEVPPYILQEKEGKRKRAIDLIRNDSLLGLNHLALDVSACILERKQQEGEKDTGNKNHNENCNATYGLEAYIKEINDKSVNLFGKTLRIAFEPRQQMIGSKGVYELAFLYDADGSLVELLNFVCELEQVLDSGWEPWDGQGFVGMSSGVNNVEDDPLEDK